MKSILSLSALVLIAVFQTSCENPADKTIGAKVNETENALIGTGTKYIFTDKSKIGFTGSKVTGSHDGGFTSFSGYFFLKDDADKPNAGSFSIDMSSVWSDAEQLTDHLKSADFFNVETFPTSTFELTGVEKTGSKSYNLSGNFSLHGITKNITFPVAAEKNGKAATFQTEFDINRKDFGIAYTGKANDLIRDEVVIRLDFEARAQ